MGLSQSCLKLFLGNSSYRTLACAGTTGNASICVDFKFGIACRDSANGALRFAGTARYARITNNKCHSISPPYILN